MNSQASACYTSDEKSHLNAAGIFFITGSWRKLLISYVYLNSYITCPAANG